MKSFKKTVLAGALSLAMCVVALAGTTYAWFTDSVTNKGNKIEAGELNIEAYVATDAAAGDSAMDYENYLMYKNYLGNDLEVGYSTESNLETMDTPVINDELFEPGKSNFKVFRVVNTGTLAAKIKMQFNIIDGGLTDALWFTTSLEGAQDKYSMSQIGTQAIEFTMEAYINQTVDNEVIFVFTYGMEITADNEFQGKSFVADISFVAAQASYENDGFGSNEYDKDAQYPVLVATAEELSSALAAGGKVVLNENIATADSLIVAEDTVLEMNGQTLNLNEGKASIKAAVGKTLAISGNGTIRGCVYADQKFGNGGNIVIEAGENFVVESNAENGWALYGGSGSTLRVNGGTYNSSDNKGAAVEFLGKTLEIRNAVVNVSSASVLNSVGIHSNASENYLENVTVNASYSLALDFNNASAVTTVRGGKFVTDKAADDFFNPTIRYQGTLNISDAVIERVGTGILYTKTYPSATEIEGLTVNNCTFKYVGMAEDAYLDTDYKR